MYFHTDDPSVIARLRLATGQAQKDSRRLRILVDTEGNLSFKVGEGMWSEPISSTPDPYRDPPVCPKCSSTDEHHAAYPDGYH